MVEGLLQQRPIDIAYLSPRRQADGGEPRPLRVQAICLVIHRGAVYFVVDVLGSEADLAERRILLSLDRLQRVDLDRKALARAYPSDFDAREFFRSAFGVWRGEERHDVRLRVDPVYASAVRERLWHETQQLEEQPDGSLIVTMQLGALDEVTDWVLGMGEHVRVEAPDALIARVTSRLEHALRQ